MTLSTHDLTVDPRHETRRALLIGLVVGAAVSVNAPDFIRGGERFGIPGSDVAWLLVSYWALWLGLTVLTLVPLPHGALTRSVDVQIEREASKEALDRVRMAFLQIGVDTRVHASYFRISASGHTPITRVASSVAQLLHRLERTDPRPALRLRSFLEALDAARHADSPGQLLLEDDDAGLNVMLSVQVPEDALRVLFAIDFARLSERRRPRYWLLAFDQERQQWVVRLPNNDLIDAPTR